MLDSPGAGKFIGSMFPILSAPGAADSTNTEEPVFIIGAPRTGSSFLVHALREAAGFGGFAEGHLTPLMTQLDSVAAAYYAQMRQQGLLDIPENMIANVSEVDFRATLAGMFALFKDRLPRSRRWLDKTVNAEAIGALPYVLSIWPRAKIIYLTRNGITTVTAIERYFGLGFRDVCLGWANCGEQWDRICPKLPPGSFMEIRHEDLVQHPLGVATQIGEFIGLAAKDLASFVSFVEPRSAKWSSERGVPPELTDLDWPVARLFTFLSICGNQMCQQGYASKDEGLCEFDRESIDARRVKILDVDDADYFQLSGDGFFIVPGQERAATAVLAGLETRGLTHFEAELHVAHPNAEAVRFEFIGIDNRTGAIVFLHVEELRALELRHLRVALDQQITSLDVLIRVVKGISANSNSYAWSKVSAMCLSRGHSSPNDTSMPRQ